jgi:hypothetical protein
VTPEQWGFAGVALTQIVVLIGLFIQNRRAGGQVNELHSKVGNGWSARVAESLARIEARQDISAKERERDRLRLLRLERKFDDHIRKAAA